MKECACVCVRVCVCVWCKSACVCVCVCKCACVCKSVCVRVSAVDGCRQNKKARSAIMDIKKILMLE